MSLVDGLISSLPSGAPPITEMKKPAKTTIDVKGTEVTILGTPDGDFISLTDMLRAKDGDFFISDWLRNRNTVEFLGNMGDGPQPSF